MEDPMDELSKVLPFFIPIIALSIPLVAITGRVVIQPLVEALSRLADRPQPGSIATEEVARIRRLEADVEEVQHLLRRVLEEQEFQRQLQSGAPVGGDPAHRTP
jgi:hypothetical protein